MAAQLIQYLPLTHTRATFRMVHKLSKNNVICILDLEDSAQDPFSLKNTQIIKSQARDKLIEYVNSDRFDRNIKTKLYIRINGRHTPYFQSDLELINSLLNKDFPLEGLFIPKTEDLSDLILVDKIVDTKLELVPMIETKQGFDNIDAILNTDLVNLFHYGHFDFALDIGQWPFLDPNHSAYWNMIDALIIKASQLKKSYVHTPFPFPSNHELFWNMVHFMQDKYTLDKIYFCTLNAELSLSNPKNRNTKINFIEYPTSKEALTNEANKIIHDYEEGRANKRSFGQSNDRFIPPHQYNDAKNFLDNE